MKKRNTLPDLVKVYLGGSHEDSGEWRIEFNNLVTSMTVASNTKLYGIDPFERDIDENDNSAIIQHDIALLSDAGLRYVVLQSTDHMGNLSTGTACEMMLAFSWDIPVIIFIEPAPQGEPVWIHPFSEHFSSFITGNMHDAIQWIIQDLNTHE